MFTNPNPTLRLWTLPEMRLAYQEPNPNPTRPRLDGRARDHCPAREAAFVHTPGRPHCTRRTHELAQHAKAHKWLQKEKSKSKPKTQNPKPKTPGIVELRPLPLRPSSRSHSTSNLVARQDLQHSPAHVQSWECARKPKHANKKHHALAIAAIFNHGTTSHMLNMEGKNVHPKTQNPNPKPKTQNARPHR